MQIGERYRVTLESTPPGAKNHRPKICGEVVCVHPQGKFATLEFKGVHGKFRETFWPEQLTEKNRVRKDDHEKRN